MKKAILLEMCDIIEQLSHNVPYGPHAGLLARQEFANAINKIRETIKNEYPKYEITIDKEVLLREFLLQRIDQCGRDAEELIQEYNNDEEAIKKLAMEEAYKTVLAFLYE